MSKDGFWKDVLSAWCISNFESPTTLDNIKDTIIWFNSEIKIANTPIFYKRCHLSGMTYVKDILNDHNDFLSYQEIIGKFGYVINFIEYYGILESIPCTWKRILRNALNPNEINLTFFETFEQKLGCTSAIYNHLIDSPYLVHEQKVKWENCLQKPMDNNKYFCTLLKNIKYITLSSKLRSFQYRLLNNAVLTDFLK